MNQEFFLSGTCEGGASESAHYWKLYYDGEDCVIVDMSLGITLLIRIELLSLI